VEGRLKLGREDHPEDDAMLRDPREDEAKKDTVLGILKAECEVRTGRPRE